MDLFKSIRIKIARSITFYRLRNRRRIKKFNNLSGSHKMIILWAGDEPEEFTAISKFQQMMQSLGKQVDILCYFPGKVLPDRLTALRYLNCFKRTDLNLFYFPRQQEVIKFIDTPYDILIDINSCNHFPLYYVSAMSVAEFKIGPGGRFSSEAADMTIELGNNDGIEYFLEQVKYYLEMINSNS